MPPIAFGVPTRGGARHWPLWKRENIPSAGGKFDQLQLAQPLTAIINAFDHYFGEIFRSGAERLNVTKNAILEAAGDCCGVLTNFFPNLGQIIGNHYGVIPVQIGAREAQHRFEYVFRLMVRTLATPSNPIVVFLDDLQWAD
eukprot:5260322-Ditylum_brightwellii.AAC.1